MVHAFHPAKKFKYGDKVVDCWDEDRRILKVVGIWGGYSCCSDDGERNWYYLVEASKKDCGPGEWPVQCISEDFLTKVKRKR